MIELQFKGTREEVLGDMLAFANTVAHGMNVERQIVAARQAAMQTAVQGEQPAASPMDEARKQTAPTLAELKKPRGRPRKAETPAAEPQPAQSATSVFDEPHDGPTIESTATEVEDTEVPDDSADEQTVEQPAVPANVEEMKTFVNQAVAKVGHEKVKAIIQKYAPKISQIEAGKYAAVTAEINALAV